ncbi:MAG: AEC family transporter [Erysipelotrichaceae bacterium]|nr:AEC family transporter [Erysipelotrichaceae bacterium]
MTILTVLIKQVFIMFVLMGIGFFAYKRGLISDEGSRDIGKILLNVAIPVVVISNFCIEKTAEKTVQFLQSMLLCLICMILSIVMAYLFYHKRDRIAEFSAAFSNAGFIGIPLVQATFGNEAVFFISVMIVLVSSLQWTFGVYTMTDDRSVMDLRKIISNPIVISVIIGVLIYASGVKMPLIVRDIFSLISAINTPLAMFVSGVYLAQSDLLKIMKQKDPYLVSLARLIVIPLVTVLVFRLIPFGSRQMKLAILLAAACPVGSNVAIFAQQYGKDYRKGVEYVCISTILSILSLPLLVMIAQFVLG